MKIRWRKQRCVTVGWALASALGAMTLLASCAAFACSMQPPIVTPTPVQAAASADLVAVVRIDEEIPLSPAEQAEFDRLWYSPPPNTLIVYPAPTLRFSTLRVLKGHLPEGVVIQNGATTCDVLLQAGAQYVLFAKLPPLDGVRLIPQEGTFPLGQGESDQATLADVDRFISSSLSNTP